MKNIIYMLLIALFLTSCSSSSLTLDDAGSVNLKYKDESLLVGSDAQEENLVFFSDVSVYQYKLMSNEGGVLFGEYAQTDSMYEFAKTELETVLYVLGDEFHYEVVYRRGNLQLMQIQLKNKSYINTLIYADDIQGYIYIYGYSNKEFEELAHAIKVKDTVVQKPKYEAITLNEESKPLSHWTTELILYEPLIKLMTFSPRAR